MVDSNSNTKYILSGSQNLLLLEKVTQTLAGRAAILNLLPLSYEEFSISNIEFDRYEDLIIKGGYPRLYDKNIEPVDFYPFYVQTYLERDVRQISNIENFNLFNRFIALCAGRIGQVINYESLAKDAGISSKTVRSWLSILETSFIIYRLQPFYKNFNKRLIKTPKLYFFDTGVACSVLGLSNSNEVSNYYQKGALFENLAINEIL
ncbi:MAG: DUF4143 domain-containing protein, partial [Bacteroidota bacterium]